MSNDRLDNIALQITKSIRHMDRIDHDPEGQRILQLVSSGLREAYNLALPPDDGKTTHVTTAKDIALEIKGKEGIKGARVVQEAMPAPVFGVCGICKSIHNPREVYDHSPEPVRRTA